MNQDKNKQQGLTPPCPASWEDSSFVAWWGGFFDSLDDSLGSIATGWEAIFYDVIGNDALAQQLYADAYAKSPLGQTADSTGVFYWGTRTSLTVATVSVSAASYLIGAEMLANVGVYQLSVHAAERMAERSIPNAAVRWGFQEATRTAALEADKSITINALNFLSKASYTAPASFNGSSGVLVMIKNIWTNNVITTIFMSL